MRFPRNAKIFRGQLDLAPFLSVFFLLLVFAVLGTLVYTPGTPLRVVTAADLSESAKNPVILIKKTGDIVFLGKTYNLGTLEDFRERLKQVPRGSIIRLSRPEPGAPRELLVNVREIITQAALHLENGSTIELPAGSPDRADPGRTIAVAIDLSGQFYFDNQFISEDVLQAKLTEAARKAPDLTLVVRADRDVNLRTLSQLTQIAQNAGIQDVRLATRPNLVETGKLRPSSGK